MSAHENAEGGARLIKRCMSCGREHECGAPAAPPEGEHRKRIEALVRGLHHYGCPPDSRLQRKVDADVADVLDSFDAALAAATARAAGDEAGRLRWEQEAERLRGERADLQHKLAHWQRVAEESEAMAARRVEAMREAGLKAYRKAKREACGLDLDQRCYLCEREFDSLVPRALPATTAPGPSAEDALRWACANERRFQFGCYETEWEYVARGLAALTRAPGGQDGT